MEGSVSELCVTPDCPQVFIIDPVVLPGSFLYNICKLKGYQVPPLQPFQLHLNMNLSLFLNSAFGKELERRRGNRAGSKA